MTKYKKIFLSIMFLFLTFTKSKADIGHEYKYFQCKHPYLSYNIKQMIIYIVSYLALCSNLENKGLFDNASKKEIETVKAIAKELGFSKRGIKNIKVKTPKKYNNFDEMFKNNYAAFLKTLIIGRQDHEVLSEVITRPGVKNFIYAHELSHIKYNHSVKTFFAFLVSPIITHFGVKCFNKVYKKIIKSIGLNWTPRIVKSTIKCVPGVLDSAITKIFLQIFLWISIRKQFEKQADLSAASLGPETIKGGILFLKTVKKIQEDQNEDILEQFSNKVIKKLICIALGIKSFVSQLWDPHPSHETRIAYLKNVLKKQI
ncbi:M48 family metalloprotease [Candidatus Dependentiae bacterium]